MPRAHRGLEFGRKVLDGDETDVGTMLGTDVDRFTGETSRRRRRRQRAPTGLPALIPPLRLPGRVGGGSCVVRYNAAPRHAGSEIQPLCRRPFCAAPRWRA